MNIKVVEKLLETYTFEELLDQGDLTVAEALCFLIDQGLLELPVLIPVDVEDEEEQEDTEEDQ